MGRRRVGGLRGSLPFFSALDALWEGSGDVRVYENCGRSEGGHSEISKVMSRYSFVHARSLDSVDQPFEFYFFCQGHFRTHSRAAATSFTLQLR